MKEIHASEMRYTCYVSMSKSNLITKTELKLVDKEKDAAGLLKGDEMFSEQLASSVEHPAADSEEAGNGEMNGHGEPAHDAPAQKGRAQIGESKMVELEEEVKEAVAAINRQIQILEKQIEDDEILEDGDEESDHEDLVSESVEDKVTLTAGKVTKYKLLQFHEDRGPIYWGTWTKKSNIISGRRPLGIDEEWIEYDYDSDENWGEVGDGKEDNYRIDHEVFVPHGYLSEDEKETGEEDAEEKLKRAKKQLMKKPKRKPQQRKLKTVLASRRALLYVGLGTL